MNDEFQDIGLTCVRCCSAFTWTAGQQEFFSRKGLVQPRRCPACRAIRRQEHEQANEHERDTTGQP
jgi:hypothetical protein